MYEARPFRSPVGIGTRRRAALPRRAAAAAQSTALEGPGREPALLPLARQCVSGRGGPATALLLGGGALSPMRPGTLHAVG